MLTFFLSSLPNWNVLKNVESHLLWIEDEDLPLPKVILHSHQTMKDYISWFLDHPPADRSTEDVNKKSGSVDPMSISLKLNLAAMCVYAEKYSEAGLHLEDIRRQAGLVRNFTDVQKEAVEYCLEALEWSSRQLQIEKSADEDEEGQHIIASLNRKREGIRTNGSAEAVIQFLKGSLLAVLTMSEDKQVNLIESAIELDPGCYWWHHYLFDVLRCKRNYLRDHVIGGFDKACEKEKKACYKCTELAPNDFEAYLDKGIRILDDIPMKDGKYWVDYQDVCNDCVKLFKKACETAIQNGQHKDSCTAKMYLGECLIRGKGVSLKLELSPSSIKQLMYLQHEKTPNSSLVLHKLGDLHHYGSVEHKDFTKASEFYRRALDIDGRNFSCLMSYVEVLKTEANEQLPQVRCFYYRDMLVAINNSLQVMKRDYHVAKLWTLKASLIWLYNPNKVLDHWRVATKNWIAVLKDYPEFEGDICKTIQNPFPFDWKNPAQILIYTTMLIQHLTQMKAEEAAFYGDQVMSEAIAFLIVKLQSSMGVEGDLE